MTKLNRLKRDAKEAVLFRKHRVARFVTTKRGAVYTCPACQSWATVTPKPQPNGIDIGGSAVAVTCPNA